MRNATLQLKVALEISGGPLWSAATGALCFLDCDRLRLTYARNREALFFPARRALIFAVVLAAVTIFAYRPAGMEDFYGTTTPISSTTNY